MRPWDYKPFSIEPFSRRLQSIAQDFFFSKKRRAFVSSLFLNLFAFDRKKNGLNGLKKCHQIIKHPSHILILFPEGTRSRDGRMQSFKRGISHLSCLETWIVPAGICGSFHASPNVNFSVESTIRTHICA